MAKFIETYVSALILKSGTINDVWVSSEAGMHGTAFAKDIRHVILCTRQRTGKRPRPVG
jgi:hypothetical protein